MLIPSGFTIAENPGIILYKGKETMLRNVHGIGRIHHSLEKRRNRVEKNQAISGFPNA